MSCRRPCPVPGLRVYTFHPYFSLSLPLTYSFLSFPPVSASCSHTRLHRLPMCYWFTPADHLSTTSKAPLPSLPLSTPLGSTDRISRYYGFHHPRALFCLVLLSSSGCSQYKFSLLLPHRLVLAHRPTSVLTPDLTTGTRFSSPPFVPGTTVVTARSPHCCHPRRTPDPHCTKVLSLSFPLTFDLN